jgi:hypothetical protein
MFSRVNPSGWALHSKLTSTQQNNLDIDHANAIDGAGGSAGTPYTPSTQIIVGGEGIYNLELTNIAALKAINTTSMSTGALRRVIGFGRYYLDQGVGASDTEDQPLVVAPTTGTGRWFALDDDAAVLYIKTFSATGTWVCPRNLALIDYDCWGSGGGGGGGANTTSSTDVAPGGAGGGAGLRARGTIAPTPTTSYAITVAAGGAGGTATSNGTDGGSSSIGALVSALGGQGGGASVANSGTNLIISGGGPGMAGVSDYTVQVGTVLPSPTACYAGGAASNYNPVTATAGAAYGMPGGSSHEGFLGGARGAPGTTSGSEKGGSGGGGGSAGPGGVGGAGGAGGNGNNSGAGVAGSNGSAAAANTGAGGGGGGGAGAGSTGSAAGSTGGTGGSGQVVIRGRAIVQSYV